MTPLIIAGCGGFGRETLELVHALNAAGGGPTVIGFVDDDPGLAGSEVMGQPVLGPIDAVVDHPDALITITVGNPSNYFTRRAIVDRLGLEDARYATLVHPTAVVPQSVNIGSGSVLGAGVVATAAVALGRHVVVMPQVVLTHDDEVRDYATFGAGVRLAGRVLVDQGAYVGSGALVREDLSIGAWSLVGMGSVVTQSVPAFQVWAGVPAQFVRNVTEPEPGI